MVKASTIAGSNNSQSIRELSIIINISQSIINTLDYEKVLQIISDGMSELLEIESAALYILINDDELLMGATTPPIDPQIPTSLRKAYLKDHPNIHKAILSKKPLLLSDVKKAELSPQEKSIVEMRQLKSLIFFPFVQEGNVLGVLVLATCNKYREYTKHEIDLGQTVANQLTVAIQNTRLHDDLKNHKNNLEKLVIERTHELEAAYEELLKKNEIVFQQKEEIETTLKNLKIAQSQLIQSEKMASLGILTSGVAHEINNPLNFIAGASVGLEEYFIKYGSKDEQKTSFFLNSIKTGIERTSNIVKGLNQFSRNNTALNEDCNLHLIIDTCLTILNSQIQHKIEIKKDYAQEIIVVKGNVGKLHQVFINILTNAIQSITMHGKIVVSTHTTDHVAIIEITDNGQGITVENLPKITEPFFTTKKPGQGTGLGLSIAHSIVNDHHGNIDFESNIDKGTKVKITLPLKLTK
jgi:signal transduction histidine kinase